MKILADEGGRLGLDEDERDLIKDDRLRFNDCDSCNDDFNIEIMRTPALSSIAQPALSLSSIDSYVSLENNASIGSTDSVAGLLQEEEGSLRIACANARSIVELSLIHI